MKLLKRHISKKVFLLLTLTLSAYTIYSQKDSVYIDTMTSYFNQARILKNQNNLDSALVILNKAQTLAEQKNDKKSAIDSYHQLALLYLKINREEAAEIFWDRSKTLSEDIEYPYGEAIFKFIEAQMLYRKENYFQAIFMLEEAKQLNNDRNFFNNVLLLEADIFVKLEKYEVASKNYNSLIVNTDIHEKEYLATLAHLGLANLHYRTGDYEEGVSNGESALKLAKQNNFFNEIKEANELLALIYEKAGKYNLALQKNKNLTAIKDSLFNIQKVKSEVKTADKIQFDFMSNTIKKQEKEIEELTDATNRSEIIMILVSAFLIIISLLAVSLYRNNQIKLKTNDLLQTKNNELKAARDSAISAMEAKTNFLSTVSHELRTPLYAVTGLTHLLLEENPNENQQEHLNALKFSGDYLLNFINDILQINKIDADKLKPLISDFNLKRTITEVIDSLQQSASQNNTEIVLDYDDTIPNQLMSDPIKLSQIFMNLIGNALKFTKNGEVKVIAKMVKKIDEDITLYFEVADTGIGISQEKLSSIFEGFEQGSIQINREYGGTGLGLTIVKSLLGLFDSKIQLKSELGKGSSFFFELKVKSNQNMSEDTHYPISEHNFEFKGLHLMVVEDNKINQVITKKMLIKKEMTCDIASNGLEAVALATDNNYDAILMDIHMPGISGEEATIRIREFDKTTPIIALTAISLDDSLESFYAAGCNDVVTKPFKPEVFYQKIGENIFIKKPIS